MSKAKIVPYRDHVELPESEMRERAQAFRAVMARRRSVRQFSNRKVDRAIVEECIHAAHSGPSGANMQPWHFALVSDPAVKSEIRHGAEQEEREFYDGRAGEHWLEALEPIGTTPLKPFLETAPYLIVVFQKNYAISANHQRLNHYYVPESVGIAVGILISGLQHAGLSTLIHTPRPMGFLRRILNRPANERASMIVVTGYPATDAVVPVLKKKPYDDVVTFF
ncbi:MAG: nitroreductase family protein [Rhodospirillaceae bacterium]|nr:nitroreductase family protein [Rhodospirillaceae bacterium]